MPHPGASIQKLAALFLPGGLAQQKHPRFLQKTETGMAREIMRKHHRTTGENYAYGKYSLEISFIYGDLYLHSDDTEIGFLKTYCDFDYKHLRNSNYDFCEFVGQLLKLI